MEFRDILNIYIFRPYNLHLPLLSYLVTTRLSMHVRVRGSIPGLTVNLNRSPIFRLKPKLRLRFTFYFRFFPSGRVSILPPTTTTTGCGGVVCCGVLWCGVVWCGGGGAKEAVGHRGRGRHRGPGRYRGPQDKVVYQMRFSNI